MPGVNVTDGVIVCADARCFVVRGDRLLREVRARHLGGPGLAAIASAEWIRHLRELNLKQNRIGTEGATAFARAAAKQLVDLDLTDNALEDGGAQALKDARFPRLRRIGLKGNLLYSDEVENEYDQGVLMGSSRRLLTSTEIASRFGFDRIGWFRRIAVY